MNEMAGDTNPAEPGFLTIAAASRLIESKELSPVELATACSFVALGV